jgi:hypothetical protein
MLRSAQFSGNGKGKMVTSDPWYFLGTDEPLWIVNDIPHAWRSMRVAKQ